MVHGLDGQENRELLTRLVLRYGEPQLVVHVATNRAIASEIQRGARAWAREVYGAAGPAG